MASQLAAGASGHVYVTRLLPDGAMEALRDLPHPVSVHQSDSPPDRRVLLAQSRGAAAIVTLLTDQVNEELLQAAGPQLRVVANLAVGYDNLDVGALARHGVLATNTPGVLDEATADLTLALILATTRRVAEADRFMRRGQDWTWSPRMFTGLDLSAGAVLGIVGLGRIGMAVARRAAAFRLKVVATGRKASSQAAVDLGVEAVELDKLIAESDVVSVHCPLVSDTYHLFNADTFARMRPTAILVNTARGPIVDEAALVAALREGEIAAAGLDVFEHEPAVHPDLLGMENVVLLPHIGSAGAATREAMGRLAIANVASVLSGGRPITGIPELD